MIVNTNCLTVMLFLHLYIFLAQVSVALRTYKLSVLHHKFESFSQQYFMIDSKLYTSP